MGRIAKTNPLHLALVKQHEDRKAIKDAGIKPLSPATAAQARSGKGSAARYRAGRDDSN